MQIPAKDGKPDYATMETLISAVQKLVIKEVVLYIQQATERDTVRASLPSVW